MMFAVVAILLLGGASVEAQPWNRDTVNLDAGKDARDTSVAVDTRGIVHIAYIDSKGVVKVARKEGTGYNRDTVDAEAGQASKHPAIAVDTQGIVHIAYSDGKGAIRAARKEGPRGTAGTRLMGEQEIETLPSR
jgi:hypothetical protein